MTELSPWLPLGTAFFALGLVTVLSSYKSIYSLHSLRLNQSSQAAIWSLSLLIILGLWVGMRPESSATTWALALGGTFIFGLFAQKCPSEFSFWSKKRARYIYLILFCTAFVSLIFLGIKPAALLILQILLVSVLAARNHRLAVNGILSDLQISQSKLLTHIARKNHAAIKAHTTGIQTNDASIGAVKSADAS